MLQLQKSVSKYLVHLNISWIIYVNKRRFIRDLAVLTYTNTSLILQRDGTLEHVWNTYAYLSLVKLKHGVIQHKHKPCIYYQNTQLF